MEFEVIRSSGQKFSAVTLLLYSNLIAQVMEPFYLVQFPLIPTLPAVKESFNNLVCLFIKTKGSKLHHKIFM